jgi:hypothetical protein
LTVGVPSCMKGAIDEAELRRAIGRSLLTFSMMGREIESAGTGRVTSALEDHLRALMANGLSDPRQLHVAGVKHLVGLKARLCSDRDAQTGAARPKRP